MSLTKAVSIVEVVAIAEICKDICRLLARKRKVSLIAESARTSLTDLNCICMKLSCPSILVVPSDRYIWVVPSFAFMERVAVMSFDRMAVEKTTKRKSIEALKTSAVWLLSRTAFACFAENVGLWAVLIRHAVESMFVAMDFMESAKRSQIRVTKFLYLSGTIMLML